MSEVAILCYFTELFVTISVSYNPPPGVVLGPNEYRAASGPVNVTCSVEGANGTVRYQWSSTCRNCVFKNLKSNSVFRAAVHSGDTGSHTCRATDGRSISGSDTINFHVVGKCCDYLFLYTLVVLAQS